MKTDLEMFSKDSAMNREYDAWQVVNQECKQLGIDMNNKKYDPLIKAICVWGERLHALRAMQTPEQCSKAMIDYLNQYAIAKEKQ